MLSSSGCSLGSSAHLSVNAIVNRMVHCLTRHGAVPWAPMPTPWGGTGTISNRWPTGASVRLGANARGAGHGTVRVERAEPAAICRGFRAEVQSMDSGAEREVSTR